MALPGAHRRFLKRLRLTFTCGDFFFVHAGVRPGIRLWRQREADLLWIRDVFLESEENFGKYSFTGTRRFASPTLAQSDKYRYWRLRHRQFNLADSPRKQHSCPVTVTASLIGWARRQGWDLDLGSHDEGGDVKIFGDADYPQKSWDAPSSIASFFRCGKKLRFVSKPQSQK